MIDVEDVMKNVMGKYGCCAVWPIAISFLARREKNFFEQFTPKSKTALVLGHHVTTKAEWTWFVKGSEGEECVADTHSQVVCENLKNELQKRDYPAMILPYPGESGLQFRFVAQAAGAGEIGMNAFLLHPEWGPWIHLRILATEAPARKSPSAPGQICNQCRACVAACPASAITPDEFDGLLCRRYRKSRGEYKPVGPARRLRYCTICADVCPIGQLPG
jgi:epoxyqueuosine reductase QueG